MSETVEDTFQFNQDVQTVNGMKTIVANSQEALDEAVEAALAEPLMVSPDIDNPAHANLHGDDLMNVPGAPQADPALVVPAKRSHKKKVVE